MKNIDKQIWDKAYSYEEYLALIDSLLEQEKSTGPNQSEALFNYSKLNRKRMKRVGKTARLKDTNIAQLDALERPQKWLVVTEGWCGDAAQSVPAIANLAKATDKVELRLILRDENLEVIDAFLTNGGRSIPVLIMMDAETNEVIGRWGPRPTQFQKDFMERLAALKASLEGEEYKTAYQALQGELQLWYTKDKAQTIMQEVVQASTFVQMSV